MERGKEGNRSTTPTQQSTSRETGKTPAARITAQNVFQTPKTNEQFGFSRLQGREDPQRDAFMSAQLRERVDRQKTLKKQNAGGGNTQEPAAPAPKAVMFAEAKYENGPTTAGSTRRKGKGKSRAPLRINRGVSTGSGLGSSGMNVPT
jgi:hypothetical protein